MHRSRTVFAVLAAGAVAGTVALAQNGTPINPNSKNPLTVAVYGDSPYGATATDTSQNEETPAFIDSINRDPKVDLVVHVGDIHSGKQLCTEDYDRMIFNFWLAFKNPVIYTPGDNEWTDCQKSGEGGNVFQDPPTNSIPVDYANGNPLANLDLIRSIFFSTPGFTLGGRNKQVLSQAQTFDALHPADATYVENVMWEQSRVLFVTLNIPGGSNNDSDNWYGAARTQAQTDEIAQRTQADLDWLNAAFTEAAKSADAVVIVEQSDMWDLDSKPASHIANYEPFVGAIAAHALDFGKPVLLFNGDSHHYRSDNPLKQGQPCVFESGVGTGVVDCTSIPSAPDFTQDAWANHPGYNVPNFHRVVVHGSTDPLEWLRLTITPGVNAPASSTAFGPFAWQRVQPLQ